MNTCCFQHNMAPILRGSSAGDLAGKHVAMRAFKSKHFKRMLRHHYAVTLRESKNKRPSSRGSKLLGVISKHLVAREDIEHTGRVRTTADGRTHGTLCAQFVGHIDQAQALRRGADRFEGRDGDGWHQRAARIAA